MNDNGTGERKAWPGGGIKNPEELQQNLVDLGKAARFPAKRLPKSGHWPFMSPRKKDRGDSATATSNYPVEAIMKLPIPLLAFFVSLPAVAANSATPSNATNAALLEQGRKIFVTRCAKCHDNDANKKLPDGTTLLGRLAKSQDPEARLGTRLKDPQERHAVMIYVDSLLKGL